MSEMLIEIQKRLEAVKQSKNYNGMSSDEIIDNLLDIIGALLVELERINNAIFEISNEWDI